jgi:Family of unknown function (DUF5317)
MKVLMFRLLRVTMLWIILLPYAVMGLGEASNQLVLIANHDKFPVMENDYHTAKETVLYGVTDVRGHCLMTHDTRMNSLADIFDLGDGWYSIGDLLLMVGEWLNGFCIYVWIALVISRLKATTK